MKGQYVLIVKLINMLCPEISRVLECLEINSCLGWLLIGLIIYKILVHLIHTYQKLQETLCDRCLVVCDDSPVSLSLQQLHVKRPYRTCYGTNQLRTQGDFIALLMELSAINNSRLQRQTFYSSK